MRDRLVWTVTLFLCLVGATAAANRAFHVGDAASRGGPLRTRALEAMGIHDAVAADRQRASATFDARFGAHPGMTRTHVILGGLFLVFAPLQFYRPLRTRYPSVHRWSGRTLLVLLVLSVIPSIYFGVIAPVAGAWEASIIALVAMMVAGGAARGFWAIRHRRVWLHREWMVRLFALGIGIASVRLVVLALDLVTMARQLPFATIYPLSLWIGWGGTLAAAELWISITASPREESVVPSAA